MTTLDLEAIAAELGITSKKAVDLIREAIAAGLLEVIDNGGPTIKLRATVPAVDQ